MKNATMGIFDMRGVGFFHLGEGIRLSVRRAARFSPVWRMETGMKLKSSINERCCVAGTVGQRIPSRAACNAAFLHIVASVCFSIIPI